MGQEVELVALGAKGAGGWDLGDERMAAGPRAQHRFARLGPHRVRFVLARPDGSVARAETTLRVRTWVREGCSESGGSHLRPSWGLPLVGILWLIGRWNRKGAPNRYRPSER